MIYFKKNPGKDIYLKRKAVSSKSMTDWSAYRNARNHYNKLMKDTIPSYYQNIT